MFIYEKYSQYSFRIKDSKIKEESKMIAKKRLEGNGRRQVQLQKTFFTAWRATLTDTQIHAPIREATLRHRGRLRRGRSTQRPPLFA